MTCTHNFVRINDASKQRSNEGEPVSWNGMIDGATVGCVHCGEIRTVYSDGEVRLVKLGGGPTDKHGTSAT